MKLAFTRLAAIIVTAAIIPRAAAAQAVDSPAHQSAIERARTMARALVDRDTLPGLSIAVGIDGRIVWAEGFGWADVEARNPVTPLTRFRMGSVGKAMTSAGVGLLVQRGRLDLDAPVQSYVPEFPEKRWPVTTRQLMGHLGGIRHYGTEAEVMGDRHCNDVREGIADFAADSLLARPGTRYSYSSLGYTLVSAAMQAAAGEPYADFMRREVFAALGMDRTIPEPPGAPHPERAALYVRSSGLVPAPHDDDSCVLAAGGFISTPSDLARFGFGMMNDQLLAPETRRLLWTSLRLNSGESTGYGLGWFIREVRLDGESPAVPMIGHGGSSVGGSTSFMLFPEQRMVIAVTTNVSGATLTSFAGALAQVFRPGARS
ncbi:MAG TPA: serine hydrolase domain-containing protein [Longimicrobium sp.]|jgi:CubicO group peptidase (beta-lactamase class C family)